MWLKDFELHQLRYRDLEKERYGTWTNYSKDEIEKIKAGLEKIIQKINKGEKDGKT